tara:strand:+ start:971 stop:1645 length:675 start_codon:yes stop_codon:yes gene_type:complete
MKTKKNLFVWIFIFIFLSTYSLNSIQKKKISFFSIKKINVEGVLNVNSYDLESALKEFYGKNLIFLNREKLNEIGSKFSFIKEIKIKKIYPSTLNIIVKENKPLGILIEKDKKILLLENGNEILNFKLNMKKSLLVVKGEGARKKFHKFHKILKTTNFEIELIQELNYFDVNRWDIVLKNGKVVKLPTDRIVRSIEKFISIYDKDSFSNFKIFDFRINGQLILE